MDVSIIIPCYNSGRVLDEALESISRSDNLANIAYEIIIVNDGSTDGVTLGILNDLNGRNRHVIHQNNQGPASARNTGIRASKGENLLFLDSDNKLRSNFISTALTILQKTDADIVYGKPHFFGDLTRDTFTPGPFDMNSMLLQNFIDMCSMIRKKVWTELGGLDESKILIGFEDWEFWIRAGSAGYKFKYVDEVFFEYRINANSLLAGKNVTENYDKVVDYVYAKHAKKIQAAYRSLYPKYSIYLNDHDRPLRSFIKYMYMKYIKPFYDLEKKGYRKYDTQKQ